VSWLSAAIAKVLCNTSKSFWPDKLFVDIISAMVARDINSPVTAETNRISEWKQACIKRRSGVRPTR
jgi:hypothetical protein